MEQINLQKCVGCNVECVDVDGKLIKGFCANFTSPFQNKDKGLKGKESILIIDEQNSKSYELFVDEIKTISIL